MMTGSWVQLKIKQKKSHEKKVMPVKKLSQAVTLEDIATRQESQDLVEPQQLKTSWATFNSQEQKNILKILTEKT